MSVKELDREYIANTYARFPLTLVRGCGSLVYDSDGKEYIDLGTGIAVNTFGIGDEVWKDAVIAQLDKIQHTSNLYFSEPCAILAKLLCDMTGMKKVFFSNSGAEANECAIKAARRYGEVNHGAGHTTIITLKNSFHGRTLTTLAATGQDTFHKDFLPLTEGFAYAEPGDIDGLKKLCEENGVCAIMFEVVQGEGGVVALDRDYLLALESFARENDILLIADEVQIGNGRSGKLYGYMNYGITPDIVTTAKGLAGGLPIGATMLGERVQDIYSPGLHGSTFGGNPISCAAAVSVLSRIDEPLLEEVREKSQYIFETLEGAPGIESVSGMGLMIGVKTERDASEVISECMERGVLVIKAKQKVRMLPALNIPMKQLKKAIDIFMEVCAK